MRRRRLLLAGALLLAAVQADAAVQRYRFQHTESRPPAVPVPQFIVADLESELPSSGVRKGDLGYAKDSDKFFKRTASAWTEVGGGSGGAPTGAQYWTGAADATLTAEKDLGALSTGLVLNTAGVPSAYAGTSCTNQFPRSLNASGAATCATVADADVVNTITLDNLTQITTRAISDTTGTLAVARGGTNLTASADDNVMVGNGTTWETKAIPDCDAATTAKLLYDITTNTFSCGTDQTGGGGDWTTVKKLTTQTIQSDAILNADAALQITLSANTDYHITCEIFFDTAAAADFDWRHAFTGTTSIYRLHRRWIVPSGTAYAGIAVDQAASAADLGVLSAGTNGGWIAFHGTLLVSGTGGTFSFDWAQTTSTASNTSVLAGSYCQYATF